MRASVGRVTLNGLGKPDWQKSSHIDFYLHCLLWFQISFMPKRKNAECPFCRRRIFRSFYGVLINCNVVFICTTCQRRTGNFKWGWQARLVKILTYRFLFALLIVDSNILHVETKKRGMSFLQEMYIQIVLWCAD